MHHCRSGVPHTCLPSLGLLACVTGRHAAPHRMPTILSLAPGGAAKPSVTVDGVRRGPRRVSTMQNRRVLGEIDGILGAKSLNVIRAKHKRCACACAFLCFPMGFTYYFGPQIVWSGIVFCTRFYHCRAPPPVRSLSPRSAPELLSPVPLPSPAASPVAAHCVAGMAPNTINSNSTTSLVS